MKPTTWLKYQHDQDCHGVMAPKVLTKNYTWNLYKNDKLKSEFLNQKLDVYFIYFILLYKYIYLYILFYILLDKLQIIQYQSNRNIYNEFCMNLKNKKIPTQNIYRIPKASKQTQSILNIVYTLWNYDRSLTDDWFGVKGLDTISLWLLQKLIKSR